MASSWLVPVVPFALLMITNWIVTIDANNSNATVQQRMQSHGIVPDVITTAPVNLLTVKYASGVEAQLGNELKPIQVKDQPTEISWSNKEPNALYTLIFSDPDPPTRNLASLREVLHWAVVNIPESGDISKGDILADFVGSAPPQGYGLHRYVYLLFKQPARIAPLPWPRINATTRKRRWRFNTNQFVAQHQLGAPVAGNFYLAQNDEYASARRAQRLTVAMRAEQVVPNVIDSVPPQVVELMWPSGVPMSFGAEVTPTQAKDYPAIVSWPAKENELYTLVLTDPDAPSRKDPKYGEVLHWLVVNIPGTNITKGDTLTEYIGSGAPQGTGLHRYVLLVYKQPDNIKRLTVNRPRATNRSRDGRPRFKVRDFAREYNLGSPVAGNFFQAQFDQYVPILHAQLSGNSTKPKQ